MFRRRLSKKRAWPCVFLNDSHNFSYRAPFWRSCTFAYVLARFFQSVFVVLEVGVFADVATNEWIVFLILPLTREYILFPGKAHAINSSRDTSSLVRINRS